MISSTGWFTQMNGGLTWLVDVKQCCITGRDVTVLCWVYLSAGSCTESTVALNVTVVYSLCVTCASPVAKCIQSRVSDDWTYLIRPLKGVEFSLLICQVNFVGKLFVIVLSEKSLLNFHVPFRILNSVHYNSVIQSV